MNFQQSLDYLYGLQRFGIKLGLQNMQALASRLVELRQPLPCVHVAGTNGKGSVCAMLAEMLRQSGLRTGLYTSPHLQDFTERIRIDGQPLSEAEVVRLAGDVRAASADIPVTFFEATTAMALLAFQRQTVDVAILETGMGGRLDATNQVTPMVSVITPVGLDHQQHLGATIKEIAAEKAGIIKAGVPVVVGHQHPAAEAVLLATAEASQSPVLLAGRDFVRTGDHRSLSVKSSAGQIDGIPCALAGDHQLDNLAQAVTVALLLRNAGINVTDEAIRHAGRSLVWPGRLEWFGTDGRILLDAAHNAAGSTALDRYLAELGIDKVRVVAALSGDRSPAQVLGPLAERMAGLYAVPLTQEDGVPPASLVAWAHSSRLPAAGYNTAWQGVTAARDDLRPGEVVVVCGSLFLIAALRPLLIAERSASGERVVGYL